MDQTDQEEIKSLFKEDLDSLYTLLGEEIEKEEQKQAILNPQEPAQEVRIAQLYSPIPPTNYLEKGREWWNNHTTTLQDNICKNDKIRTFAQEKTTILPPINDVLSDGLEWEIIIEISADMISIIVDIGFGGFDITRRIAKILTVIALKKGLQTFCSTHWQTH
ncbi:MAG: hypothetical protein KTR28_04525 [Micavibrio sp.]|nr:hypothetical protein [Micavibrio sp.]